MIVVTVFLSILNQMQYHLVQNLKENYRHDHTPFNVKGNGNIVFSVYFILSSKAQISTNNSCTFGRRMETSYRISDGGSPLSHWNFCQRRSTPLKVHKLGPPIYPLLRPSTHCHGFRGTLNSSSIIPNPIFFQSEIFLNEISTKIVFFYILTKPKDFIIHFSSILA